MDDFTKSVLLKDYELKVSFFKEHLARMWTRFNYFLTLQTGLTGAKILYTGALTINKFLIVLCIVLSFLWILIGIIDKGLVENYRNQIELVFEKIKLLNYKDLEDIPFTSEIEEHKMNSIKLFIRSFASPTKLIYVLPILTFIFWIVIFIQD